MTIFRFISFVIFVCSAGLAYAEPLSFNEIAPGIFVHQGQHQDLSEGYQGDICNLSFVIGSQGIAVIDTGGSFKVGKQMLEAIRKQSNKPILYVINTHVHPDHIFGNAAFLAEKPQFIGHANLAEAMEKRKESYMRLNQSWMGEAFNGSKMIRPDIGVKNTDTISLGDKTLTLTAYPTAHTNTDLTVVESNSHTLWTGDLLFVERTPSIDGDIHGWLNVITQLKQIDSKNIVPGHGATTTQKSAFDTEERYLNTLLKDIKADISKGIVMEKSMETAAQSERNQWQLFDIVNRRNVNMLYPKLEWE